MLNDQRISAEKTLFIDDSIQHIEAAKKIGILSYHLKPEEDLDDHWLEYELNISDHRPIILGNDCLKLL